MSTPNTHPKVFISYSHDSLEHSDRVRKLSDRLRADGIDCILDQYEVSPPEGWPRWMDKQVRDADFVLMICTRTYYLRVMGDEKPGVGLGVRWEGNLIYQYVYDAETVNTKFIPVLLESGKLADIPTSWRGVARYQADIEEGYDELYRRLSNQPEHQKPELGKVRELSRASKLQPLPPKEQKQDFFAAQLTNLPFARNPFFTGREKILDDLHTAFTKNGTIQAISGLGGLGKTQTAIEYAYRHRDDYKAVFWVRADSQLALSSGFVEIARVLDLPEQFAQNPQDAVRAAILWLENNASWLLVCDNADTPELIRPLRPRNALGDILLTSRASIFDSLGIAKPFEIDVMFPEEAEKFLFTRAGRDNDNAAEREAAVQLAAELGYLPLALEQAGAYVTAKKARFQTYLASFRKRRLELLNESRPVTGEYSESLATTWAINFGEIEKTSEAASDLLRMSAFLSPDSIPFELITKGKLELGPALSAALADVDSDPLALNNVLEPLSRYSFIRLDNDLQTYSIHRLVQEVLRDGMDPETQRRWAESTIGALSEAFPEVEFQNWPLCERLLPHAKFASLLVEKWQIGVANAGFLLHQAGFYSSLRGQYVEAEALYLLALKIREKLDPYGLSMATSLNNLAVLCRAMGKYQEAESLGKRSLAIREEAVGPNHPEVAQSLNNLAALYYTQGRYDDAEPMFRRALAIGEETLGPEHPNVAARLNNLAQLYQDQGKDTEAEPLLQRALAIYEKALGPDHPDLASVLGNLAELYRTQGRFAEAGPLYQRTLAIDEKALGPEHPNLAFDLNNLALFNKAQGNYEEAALLYQRSLEILQRALGPDHPNVRMGLKNYAILLRTMKRYDEAAELEARAQPAKEN